MKPLCSRRRLVTTAIVVLGVTIAIGICRWWLRPFTNTESSNAIAALAHAVDGQLPFDARLTGPFVGAHHVQAQRSASRPSDNWRLLEAVATVRRAAETSPTAEALHAVGIADLLLEDVDAAVETLVDATELMPRSARLLSDLSAALLARAERADAPADLARALETASQAGALEPLPQALYNRAAALDRLFLRAVAVRAWEEYRTVDSTSPWAAFAQRRLEALRTDLTRADVDTRGAPLVSRATASRSVRWMLTESLPRWADAVIAGHEKDAADATAALVPFGRDLAQATGDPTGLRIAESVNGVRQVHRLSLAWTCLGLRDLLVQSSTPQSHRRVHRAFTRVHGPAALLARIESAAARAPRDSAGAERDLVEAVDIARTSGVPYVEGRALRQLAYVTLFRGDYRGALASLSPAYTIFDRHGYAVEAADVASQLARALDVTGAHKEAWRWRLVSLQVSSAMGDRALDFSVGVALAGTLLDGRHYYAARIAAEAIGSLDPAGLPPVQQVFRLIHIARANRGIGEYELARSQAQKGRELVTALGRQPGLFADVRALEGALSEAVGDTPAAEAAYDEALASMGSERIVPRVAALLGRARTRAARRDLEAAQTDAAAALQLLKRRIRRPQRELVQLADASTAFQTMATLVDAGMPSIPSLALLEAMRSYLDDVPEGERLDTAIEVERAIEALPEGMAVLTFLVGPGGQILCWTAERGRVSVEPLDVRERDVRALASRLRTAARRHPHGPDSIAQVASALWAALLKPLSLDVASLQRLVVVPDAALHEIPFPALRDGEGQFYLFERTTVVVAPNLSFALRSGERRSVHPTTLVVGSPEPWGRGARDFARLPAARREAENISTLYNGSTLLVGEHATPEAFARGLAAADLVHYAGHAVVSSTYGEPPALVLSGDVDDGSALLRASDLPARQNGSRPIVVLAACNTASGPTVRGGVVGSLAAGFLTAGAGSVIGHLWPVPDSESVEFSLWVHQGLARGLSAPVALAEAQRRCIAGACRDAPLVWMSALAAGSGG